MFTDVTDLVLASAAATPGSTRARQRIELRPPVNDVLHRMHQRRIIKGYDADATRFHLGRQCNHTNAAILCRTRFAFVSNNKYCAMVGIHRLCRQHRQLSCQPIIVHAHGIHLRWITIRQRAVPVMTPFWRDEPSPRCARNLTAASHFKHHQWRLEDDAEFRVQERIEAFHRR